MFTVYVIVSLRSDQFYIGQTSHLINRYQAHADGLNRSTRRLRPHVIGYVEILPTRAAAMARERQLKCGSGRAWIRAEVIPQVRLWYPGEAGSPVSSGA